LNLIFHNNGKIQNYHNQTTSVDQTAWDGRVLTVWDTPYREQRLATTSDQLGEVMRALRPWQAG